MRYAIYWMTLCVGCSGSGDSSATPGSADSGQGPDLDGDGYGTPADCDDSDPSIHPGAEEYCDGINNDCDAAIDEPDAVDASLWYRDSDDDGYGDADTSTQSCSRPPGYIADGTDCDDSAALAYPGAEEICNDGADNDCDGDPTDCILVGAFSLDASEHALVGTAAGDRAGEVIAGTDLNGDGAPELLLGMTGYGDGGAVVILSGPVSADSSLSTPLAVLESGERSSSTGQAVGPAGDRNGDGFVDLVVSSPGADGAHLDSGVVFLAAGPFSGGVDLSLSAIATISGESSYDQLGAGAVGDIDVDGDGIRDLLVSSSRYGSSTDPYLGAAYLLLGPLSGDHDLSSHDARVVGLSRYDRLGDTLVSGDLDGDGLDDLVVGSASYPSNAGAGMAAFFQGGLTGEHVLDEADALLEGSIDGGGAGHALSVGDINGDGHADLLVGAPGDTGMVKESGAAYLILGPPTGGVLPSVADAVLLGVSDDDELGYSVACDGDFDGDGHADVLVGAPGEATVSRDAGYAYLFYGPISGSLDVSGGDVVLAGAVGRQRAGETVSLAVDASGDGLSDVAVSAPEDDTGGSDAGILYLRLGVGL